MPEWARVRSASRYGITCWWWECALHPALIPRPSVDRERVHRRLVAHLQLHHPEEA